MTQDRLAARSDRPRLDARATAWLLRQNERIREQELELARLRGELAASERIERVAQRYADRLEEKLEAARRREASLARALGHTEAERDRYRRLLGGSAPRALGSRRERWQSG